MERSQERRSWVAEISAALAMLAFAEIMYTGLQGERAERRKIEKGLGTEKPASLLGLTGDIFKWTTRTSSQHWVARRSNRAQNPHFWTAPMGEREAKGQWWWFRGEISIGSCV